MTQTQEKSGGGMVARLRARAAQLVWLVCALCAIVLAAGALLVALNANEDNGLVTFVLSTADVVDLVVFDREQGIKQFEGADAAVKDALFNWGLGAVAWLVIGRVLDRIVRP